MKAHSRNVTSRYCNYCTHRHDYWDLGSSTNEALTQGTALKEVTAVSLHVSVQNPLTRATQPTSPYPCFFKTVYFDIINSYPSNSDK